MQKRLSDEVHIPAPLFGGASKGYETTSLPSLRCNKSVNWFFLSQDMAASVSGCCSETGSAPTNVGQSKSNTSTVILPYFF